MPRLSLSTLVLLPLLTACDTEGDAFDDVEAIAAAKVEMCHFNNGQGEYALIDVAENAVESHVAHGDTLFADDQDCDGEADLTCTAFSTEDLDAYVASLGLDSYDQVTIELYKQIEPYSTDPAAGACYYVPTPGAVGGEEWLYLGVWVEAQTNDASSPDNLRKEWVVNNWSYTTAGVTDSGSFAEGFEAAYLQGGGSYGGYSDLDPFDFAACEAVIDAWGAANGAEERLFDYSCQ